MKTTHDLYWRVCLDYIIHFVVCNGKFDTRLNMLTISKEMILKGEM